MSDPSRRAFIKQAVATAGALGVSGAAACSRPSEPETSSPAVVAPAVVAPAV